MAADRLADDQLLSVSLNHGDVSTFPMTETKHTPRWLGRLSKATFAATLALVFVGGLVTSTGSGLAVPDWPLSFGQYFPPMQGGVLFEHGHRMVAGAVGILMTILAIAIWFVERRRWAKWLALGAWCAVVIQAILGGITVLYKLPTAVSAGHAGLATIFLSLTGILALINSEFWQREKPLSFHASRSLVWLSCAAAFIVFVQIILGATMRHMGMGQQGLAIPDFPLAYGRLIPPRLDLAPILVHFLHRVGALVVGGFIFVLSWKISRLHGVPKVIRSLSRLLPLLYIVQFALGAFTIWTIRGVTVTTFHVMVGGLTFALTVLLAALLLRYQVRERPLEAMSPLMGEIAA